MVARNLTLLSCVLTVNLFGGNSLVGIYPFGGNNHIGNYPLHKAADRGDIQQMQQLVNAGKDVNEVDEHCQTPLIFAVNKSRYDAAEWLINNGADVDSEILCLAVLLDDKKIVELLLNHGASLEVGAFYSALNTAVEWASPEVVQLLIDRVIAQGGGLNETNIQGYSPFHRALDRGRVDIMRLLFENGADVLQKRTSCCWPEPASPLFVILDSSFCHASIVLGKIMMLITMQFSPKKSLPLYRQREADFFGLLSIARKTDHVEAARLLLQWGVPVDDKDWRGRTPLVVAIERNSSKLAQLFLENGAQITEDVLAAAYRSNNKNMLNLLNKWRKDH